MFPSEMVILMDIAKNEDSRKQLVNRPMDIINEYISYLCDSLVRRGYIKGSRIKGYQLTSMGREILRIRGKNEASVKNKKPKRLASNIVTSRITAKRAAETKYGGKTLDVTSLLANGPEKHGHLTKHTLAQEEAVTEC